MRVLVVTGASGGHIFPALSFLNTLKDKHREVETLFVLPKGSIKIEMLSQMRNLKYISTSSIKLSFDFPNFMAILSFIKLTFQSLFLLLEFRPDIVVGFGSLNSVPFLLFAWLFRIKTLIHEQNVIPGRANSLLAKFVDRIAISFAQTGAYLKTDQTKIVVTGNPIRQDLRLSKRDMALNFFGFNNDKFTILVMGGSRGSHSINTNFLSAISLMSDYSRFQIIHIAGTVDYALLDQHYKNLNVKIKLFSFLNEMQNAYSASDLVICRAGATTIAELILFKLPAIIIPYPYAYKHQLSNAQILKERGCCLIIDDKELNANLLMQIISSLIDNPERLEDMRLGYEGFPRVDANEMLVQEVEVIFKS